MEECAPLLLVEYDPLQEVGGHSFSCSVPWLLAVPSSDTQTNAFFTYYITAE